MLPAVDKATEGPSYVTTVRISRPMGGQAGHRDVFGKKFHIASRSRTSLA